MSNKFIALPVGKGDSFYLQRDNCRILVDGGQSRNTITPYMKNLCKTDYLDIVVCTHNDADHAEGIIGLLDCWEAPIKEVWLPGSWSYRLKDLYTNPIEFMQEVYNALLANNNPIDGQINSIDDLSIDNNNDNCPFSLDDIFDDNVPEELNFRDKSLEPLNIILELNFIMTRNIIGSPSELLKSL